MACLWGIRHLRYAYQKYWRSPFAHDWYFAEKYRGPGEYLDAIWRGDA